MEAGLQGSVLLEFLLTHDPEDFSKEFVCDIDVIQELGTFQYIEDKEYNSLYIIYPYLILLKICYPRNYIYLYI